MIPPVLLPGDVFQRVRLPNAAGVEGKYVRIASVSGDLAQLEWVNNSASDITEGTLAAARLPATAVQTTGSYADPAWITALAASKITGTLAKSQQHAQTAYLDATSQVFAGAATFNGLLQINGASHGNNTYLQLLNNSGAIGILGSDASISGGNAADVGLSVYGDNELCLWVNSTRMVRISDSGSTFNGVATFNDITRFKTATWHTSTESTPKQRFYFDGDGTTYIQGHAATPLILRNGDGSDVLSLASTHEVSFGANNLKIHSDSTGPWIQSYFSKPLRLNPLGNEVMFTDNYWIQSTGGVNRINFATSGATYLQGYGATPFILRNGSAENIVTISSTGGATFNGNLGIGVSPTTLLDIKGDPSVLPHTYIRSTTTGRWVESQFDNGNNQLQLGVESSTPSTRMTGTLANGGYVGTYGNYGLTFHTNNQNRLTIDANGAATFNGDVKISGPDTNYLLGISGASYGCRFVSTSGTGFQIQAVDPTLSASFQPLYLKGSSVTVESALGVTGAATFNGALTAGLLNVGNANNRLFQDSGNLYIESDGTIFLRDTSTSATLWSVVNDGRTFSKTNVWHTDSDGNARILYNGSGGATNFRGAYDFVSDSRGHGFKSDGTIVWGGSQGTNNRGALSWDALDKASIIVPEKLDISAGGAVRYIGTSHNFNAVTTTFNGDVLALTRLAVSPYGFHANEHLNILDDVNSFMHQLIRNNNAGSSAKAGLVLNAYGNSWGIGMGSIANNSNALEIREDALGANTLRFKMDIGGAATFNGNVTSTSTGKLGDFTVATLPSASAYTGYECNTTDSSVTTFGSTVAGGGSSNVKVRSNGTNWTVTGI